MKSRENKVARAAHIKRHTRGTSNEISLSVLDAAKNQQDESARSKSKGLPLPRLGSVFLFTLGRAKKPAPTPTKEKGLHLSTGEFVSAEGDAREAGSLTSLSGVSSPALGAASASASAGVSSPSSPEGAVPVPQEVSAAAFSAAASPDSLEKKIRRKKLKRRRRRRIAISAIVLGVAALVAVALSAFYLEYEQQHERERVMSNLLQQVVSTDDGISEVNRFMDALFDHDFESLVSEGVSSVGEAAEKASRESVPALDRSIAGVQDYQPSLTRGVDYDASNQVLALCHSRIAMLQVFEDVLAEAKPALSAYERASAAWDDVLKGDELSRKAAKLVVDISPESAEESIALNQEAVGLFEQSKTTLVEVQQIYEADLGSYVSYLDLRVEALNAAIASDQAYLDRDKEALEDANDRYNQLDAQAVAVIENQEFDPQGVVIDRFYEVTRELFATYESEKARADEAYAVVSEYLGSISK